MKVIQFPDPVPRQNEWLVEAICDLIDNEGAVVPLTVIIADLRLLADAYQELQDRPRKRGKIYKL